MTPGVSAGPLKARCRFRHRIGRVLPILCVVALSPMRAVSEAPATPAASHPDCPGAVTGESIEHALCTHVHYLASDKLEGRWPGTPGIVKAEEYIEAAFREAGLAPIPGNDSYYLPFRISRDGFEAEGTRLTLRVGDRTIQGKLHHDFMPLPGSVVGQVEAPVVFAGYGITVGGQDDYAGLDVRGKLVLLFEQGPGEDAAKSGPDAAALAAHLDVGSRVENAKAHGASGVILISGSRASLPHDSMRAPFRLTAEDPGKSRVSGAGLYAVRIAPSLVDSLVRDTGKKPYDLQAAVHEGKSPASLRLNDVTVRMAVEPAQQPELVEARNVVGFLRGGRDPDEWIVIGAHHDHLGSQERQPGACRPEGDDAICNGADDNASGVAAVIELARAFAAHDKRPARSLVFVTFSAEEQGLLGSRAMVEQRQLPGNKIVFMLNVDMIGRYDKKVDIYGDGFVDGLTDLVKGGGTGHGLHLRLAGTHYVGKSDHDPFACVGIPFLYFSTGVNSFHHQPRDHAKTLDYKSMASIVDVAGATIRALADWPSAPITKSLPDPCQDRAGQRPADSIWCAPSGLAPE